MVLTYPPIRTRGLNCSGSEEPDRSVMSPHCQVHRAATAMTLAHPVCSTPLRHPHCALSPAVTEPFLSPGSCWEPVMCAMFCNTQGLKTPLQSARGKQGRRSHRATSRMSESNTGYKELNGIVLPSWRQEATSVCVFRVQWPGYSQLPTKVWDLPTHIAGQGQTPSAFSMFLEMIRMAS